MRLILITLITAALGVGCLVGAALLHQSAKRFDAAVEITGTVVGSEMRTTRSDAGKPSRPSYAAIYRYDYAGTQYTHTASVSTWAKPSIGDERTLLVLPDDPSQAMVDGVAERRLAPIGLAAMGLITLAMAGLNAVVRPALPRWTLRLG